jgi:hypothetical protein
MQDTSQTRNITVYLGHGYQLNFVATVNATVRLQAGGPDLSQESNFKTALMAAITEWVFSCEDGKQAWEDSCYELQICDLANAMPSPALNELLAMRGIVSLSVIIPRFSELWDCNTILAWENGAENLA